MAVRRILQIENPDDKKILKTRCHPIKTFSPALKQLAAEMFETMHAANGVGLAAPQIGITQRIAVIWIPPEVEEREDGTRIEVAPEESFVLINPQIIKVGAGEDIGQEGCLSLPGWYGDVPRHSWVTVEYQDLDGKHRRIRKAGVLLPVHPGCPAVDVPRPAVDDAAVRRVNGKLPGAARSRSGSKAFRSAGVR